MNTKYTILQTTKNRPEGRKVYQVYSYFAVDKALSLAGTGMFSFFKSAIHAAICTACGNCATNSFGVFDIATLAACSAGANATDFGVTALLAFDTQKGTTVLRHSI